MIICSTVVLRCYGSGKLVGVCNPGRNVLDLKDMQNVSNGVANPVTLIVPKLWFGNQRNYIYARLALEFNSKTIINYYQGFIT